jgi:hypothetical protein
MVKQDRLDEASWTLWRRLLSLFSSSNDKLHMSLKSWTSLGDLLRRHWTFLYSPTLHLLYTHYQNSFESCPEIRPNIFNCTPLESTDHLPDDVIPVDAADITDGWRTSLITVTSQPGSTITFHYEFASYVAELPDYDAMLLQHVNFLGRTPHQLHLTLTQSGNLLLVSDGIADNGIESTGWIIADPLGNILVEGSSSVPSVDPRSYQAEGYAMASSRTFLRHTRLYCQHLNLFPLTKLYCDNLSLVRKLNYFFTYRLAPIKCILHSEYDVLAQSFLLLQEYAITPEILHVKGHQDNKTPYQNLLLPAQLNCDADSLATTELRSLLNQIQRVPRFPSAKAQLLISSQSITRNLPSDIRRSYGYQGLLAYCTWFQWTKSNVDSIDWDSFSAASRSCFKQHNFAFKFCYCLLPIFTKTKLGMTITAQNATNLRNAIPISSNARQSAVNAGATKPPRPSANDWTQPPADPKLLTS